MARASLPSALRYASLRKTRWTPSIVAMPYSVHKSRVFDAQPHETSASGLPSAKLIGFDAPLATSMTASTVPWPGPGTTVAIFDPSGDRLASSTLSRLPKEIGRAHV